MSLLPILRFPDPGLKVIAESVTTINADIEHLIADMFETMYEAQGVGLAATQVNVAKRLIVIDISSDRTNPLVIINPTLISQQGTIHWQEGCLSFPGVFAKVKRFEVITIQFLDQHGITQTLTADGLLSICIQHEIDHLNGITFYDHLSSLKQALLRSKLQKIHSKSL